MLAHVPKLIGKVIDDLHLHFEAKVEFLGLVGRVDRTSDIERDISRLFEEAFGN